jgi:hypothetical protein
METFVVAGRQALLAAFETKRTRYDDAKMEVIGD